MSLVRGILGIGVMVTPYLDAAAQTPAPPPVVVNEPCFQIVQPPIAVPLVDPYRYLLLDRCTGKTWILIKTILPGLPKGTISYRWYPVSVDAVEGTISGP